jgi:hypothetical protein
MKKKPSRSVTLNGQNHAVVQSNDPRLKARLDAIVLLLAAIKFSDENGILKQKPLARVLHRAGYTPTEIANLFGKKKATDVSGMLY